jgi:transcriptional regulator with XRE-family HTH domain
LSATAPPDRVGCFHGVIIDKSLLIVNRHIDIQTPHHCRMDTTPIGARVRTLRKAAGMTQVQLSARSGVTQPTISDIERGHTRDLAGDNLTRLCAALKTNPDWLLFGRGSPAPAVQADIDESELLALFRALSAEQRSGLLSVVRSMQASTPQQPSTTNPFPKATRRTTNNT